MQEWISSPIGMHPVESGQWVLAADAYAERDRLAAENTELQRACNELSDELSTLHQLELEAKCHDDLEKSHAIMVQIVAERDAENADLRAHIMLSGDCDYLRALKAKLAAANATLDRMRERVPRDINKRGYSTHDVLRIWHILYPTDTHNEDR